MAFADSIFIITGNTLSVAGGFALLLKWLFPAFILLACSAFVFVLFNIYLKRKNDVWFFLFWFCVNTSFAVGGV